MDYEQKYKEALEKARQLCVYPTTKPFISDLQDIFPELKESKENKDKRVKKALSDILLIDSDEIREILDANNLLMQDIDSWLKKQGEQKSIDNLTQQEAMDIAVAKCFDEQKSDDLRTTGYWRVEDIEQNYSVNKVEPKFHEGEWITNGDYTWKIIEVKPLDYILQSQDGNIVDDTISHVDEQFHAFTIQDAKDGDVLADNVGIILFRKIGNKKYADVVNYYCIVDTSGKFEIQEKDFYWGKTNDAQLHPATKEQRDLLFQEMKEAGYEWDANEKELKKIEQGPAWSEEDERMYRGLHNLIYSTPYCDSRKELSDWLEFLKDRVQPQNLTVTDEELSQAKHYAYNDALGKIEWRNGEPTFDDGWSAAIGFLKKRNTMPQTTWKPSEGQLECLGYAIEKAEKDWSPLINNRIYLTLKALKEQLEKL